MAEAMLALHARTQPIAMWFAPVSQHVTSGFGSSDIDVIVCSRTHSMRVLPHNRVYSLQDVHCRNRSCKLLLAGFQVDTVRLEARHQLQCK